MVCTSFLLFVYHNGTSFVKKTKYTTNSMDHSPSEASKLSDSQETPHTIWNLRISYCVHKSPTFVPYSKLDQSSPCNPNRFF
jgi:hypothetical protein